MTLIRSALFVLLSNAITAVMVVIGLPIALVSRRGISRHARLWGRMLLGLSRHLLGIRPVIEGTLPKGPLLFAAKHESAYETLLLLALIDDPVIVLKRELADVPLFGRLTRRHGVIPVDRAASATALRAMLQAADIAKEQGRPVLIFPEGTRVPHGQMPKLQAGFAGLYARLAMPVVPVATDSGLAWPRGFLKAPGVVHIRFGEVIPAGLPRKEIEAQVHAAINVLNH
jgi:1-acyl-sn-glycerol-3-phosphate acyltransferase